MKNILLCFPFLSMALLGHAQKIFKNQVSLGYFSAGEFFDTSAFKISAFKRENNISLNYTRLSPTTTTELNSMQKVPILLLIQPRTRH